MLYGFLHQDSRIDAQLNEWHLYPWGKAARTARRLFASYDELEEFFRLSSWPTRQEYDPKRFYSMLDDLGYWGVRRNTLPAAAMLMNSGGLVGIGAADLVRRLPRARRKRFDARRKRVLRNLRGVSTADLRTVFRNMLWDDASTWSAECLSEGIPPEAIYVFAERERSVEGEASFLKDWPPSKLAVYIRQGASVEYILRFWESPEQFRALWTDNVPFDYAVALA